MSFDLARANQLARILKPGYEPDNSPDRAMFEGMAQETARAVGSFGGLAASYDFSENVSSDYAAVTTAIFTPADGYYLWYAFFRTTSPTGAGLLSVTLEQPGYPLSVNNNLVLSNFGTMGVAYIVSQDPMIESAGVFNVVRQVYGYAGPAGSYTLSVRMYKMA